MFAWLKDNKDALATFIAIGSIIVTGVVWTFNHQYNQYIRIGILEQNISTLQRSFASYHRTLLLTELVKVDQEIAELQEKNTLNAEERSTLVDLLVKQQVLTREIAEIGAAR